MKVPVTVNGVTIEVPVDDEIIRKTLEKKLNKTGYERVACDEFYYAEQISPITGSTATAITEQYNSFDNASYLEADYYSDENVARNNVRADCLIRKLRRFAAEHGGCPKPEFGYTPGHIVSTILMTPRKELRAYMQDVPQVGSVWFSDLDSAEEAIKLYHDELIWYFTEYNPMPEEFWEKKKDQ